MADEQRTKGIDVELTLGRLRDIQRVYNGGTLPTWLEMNVWGPVLATLAGDAADLIERYRVGNDPDFDWGTLRHLRKQLNHE
jgi:hypothetical protein